MLTSVIWGHNAEADNPESVAPVLLSVSLSLCALLCLHIVCFRQCVCLLVSLFGPHTTGPRRKILHASTTSSSLASRQWQQHEQRRDVHLSSSSSSMSKGSSCVCHCSNSSSTGKGSSCVCHCSSNSSSMSKGRSGVCATAASAA